MAKGPFRHELGEAKSPEIRSEACHRTVGLRERGNDGCHYCARARGSDTCEGVAGLIEGEHGTDEADPLDTSAFESQIRDEFALGLLKGIFKLR